MVVTLQKICDERQEVIVGLDRAARERLELIHRLERELLENIHRLDPNVKQGLDANGKQGLDANVE
jgi:hypothetical protein